MPDVALTSAGGATSTLLDEVAGTPALVFFMRSSTCPVCLAHSRAIVKMMDAGELPGHTFVLITPGDAADATRVEKSVASPRASVWASGEGHRDVGLGKFLMLQHSGTFLLDADGRVRYSRTGAVPTQSFSAAEIRAELAADD
jgi:peroxiredoxin